MYNGGEIIIVNNIIFNDNSADHATLSGGRPCIILSDCDDKLTILPLSSHKSYREASYDALILRSDLKCIMSRKLKDESYARLLSIFQRELRYYDIMARMKLDRYYRLLCQINELRMETGLPCSPIYQDIHNDLEYQRVKCKRLLEK